VAVRDLSLAARHPGFGAKNRVSAAPAPPVAAETRTLSARPARALFCAVAVNDVETRPFASPGPRNQGVLVSSFNAETRRVASLHRSRRGTAPLAGHKKPPPVSGPGRNVGREWFRTGAKWFGTGPEWCRTGPGWFGTGPEWLRTTRDRFRTTRDRCGTTPSRFPTTPDRCATTRDRFRTTPDRCGTTPG